MSFRSCFESSAFINPPFPHRPSLTSMNTVTEKAFPARTAFEWLSRGSVVLGVASALAYGYGWLVTKSYDDIPNSEQFTSYYSTWAWQWFDGTKWQSARTP